jgi:hypothetical protein
MDEASATSSANSCGLRWRAVGAGMVDVFLLGLLLVRRLDDWRQVDECVREFFVVVLCSFSCAIPVASMSLSFLRDMPGNVEGEGRRCRFVNGLDGLRKMYFDRADLRE